MRAPAVRRVRLATGVQVPFAEQGDARAAPVVLLHPYADSHRFFDLLLPHLPAHLHVLAPTQRGHGDAEKPDDGYGLGDLSADLGAFLDAVGALRAVLVGHSSGGYLAQRFAVDHPQRVLGLVLVGSPRTLHGRLAPFADAVEALRDPVDPALVREVLHALPLLRPVPAGFVELAVAESAKVPARVWRAALAGLTSAPAPTDGATITAPTLVVAGGSDALLPVAEQEALAAAVPGSRLVTYPGTGHLLAWEDPARLAADVTAFAEAVLG